MRTSLPTVRSPRGKVHAVWASSGKESGSLYGFYTLCGYCIKDIERWPEIEDDEVTCGQCCAVLVRRKMQGIGEAE